MLFKDNQKLTLIFISDMMATTVRREITTTRQVNGRQAYKARGPRKKDKKQEYYLKITHEMLVFEGWGIPYKIDTDTAQFKGNSCYNFLTVSQRNLKEFIVTKNVNKTFNQWMNICFQYERVRGDTAIDLFSDDELRELAIHNHLSNLAI